MARTPKRTRKLGKQILRLRRRLYKKWKMQSYLVKYGISQTGREYHGRNVVHEALQANVKPDIERQFLDDMLMYGVAETTS